ncbi:hypothetical protein I3843_14G039200 [Carya illinoinensis]|uniref:Secreted protein n=1 Tax=Carya illinoinensis TaxID=32201 RepID=A0A922AHJ2_CARIL|nr:hypothetical protein I3760_14G039800 [Carya illinoinensis]KAG6677715.1 hypothetical protein I3842_14G040100 [Carya illinoinensis]KAG7946443.1 hypothetical protein I3843_14G039200 [Carya illinoinensis]
MTSCFISLIAVIFCITLIVSIAQARILSSSLSSTLHSPSQDLVHSDTDRKTWGKTRPMVASSLRRIPRSGPSPTQNKWPRSKPRITG